MEKGDCDSLARLIEDLVSYDENRHRHILDNYFDEDATLSHPFLTTKGTFNIRKVYRVWISLNSQEPSIVETPVFDGETAVVRTIQHLRPRIIPFIHLQVPAQTILKLREREDGKLVVYHQEDSWTLDALIKSVPLVNWWYENVVRVALGKLVSGAGSFIYSANHATSHLTARAGEIGVKGRSVISQAQVKGVGFVTPILSSDFMTSNQQKVSQFTAPYAEMLVDGSNKVSGLTNKAFSALHQFTGRRNYEVEAQ
ncbi:8300_t:CDS:2 [Paraglomus brasilianum]|uniref:8300_t:CDS:1 n=1 Tax=Paraglomus brasilianum TaxID=144538 RepID=A0A9N8Z7X6_9GLOM|nr:8300_t:CDS:2 [Paraglomus brasilianum]